MRANHAWKSGGDAECRASESDDEVNLMKKWGPLASEQVKAERYLVMIRHGPYS